MNEIFPDEYYLRRAFRLAKRYQGWVSPNPMVGAVIVKQGKIIAEGAHKAFGEDHAEVDALKKINFKAAGASLYINLEPCCHYGRTPPCTSQIIKSGIKKVIVGSKDPNPQVCGQGIKELQQAGIEVKLNLLQEEAYKLNEAYFKYITQREPFVIVKIAQTLDARVALRNGISRWITGEEAREYVHKLRHGVDGVLVGVNTIIKDNPQLTARVNSSRGRNPWRIVLDTYSRVPLQSKIIQNNFDQRTLIVTTQKAPLNRRQRLEKLGVKVLIVPRKKNKINLRALLKKLASLELTSIMIEGGGEVFTTAFQEGIVDKVIYFITPGIVGDEKAKLALGTLKRIPKKMTEILRLRDVTIRKFKEDIMITGYIPR
jgi:diaminohydroxyphosphoribosylaminopyrimidine deaminase/5-amino-6-(5-phosphoribosylamino)uracil reductase